LINSDIPCRKIKTPDIGINDFKIKTRFRPPASLEPSSITHDCMTILILIYMINKAVGSIKETSPAIDMTL
jgi:hypothetical protein